jgi:hypothetical protein
MLMRVISGQRDRRASYNGRYNNTLGFGNESSISLLHTTVPNLSFPLRMESGNTAMELSVSNR